MSEPKRILLIDDVRTEEFIMDRYCYKVDRVARSFDEGIKALQEAQWDILLLDHDLASYDANGKEMTGYDVMLYLEAQPEKCPEFVIFVSSNPVGRKNMEAALASIRRNRQS